MEEQNKNPVHPEPESQENSDPKSQEGDTGHGYPLRSPHEDPRWAIRTVKIWLGFALFSLGFILVLLFLGAFYD